MVLSTFSKHNMLYYGAHSNSVSSSFSGVKGMKENNKPFLLMETHFQTGEMQLGGVELA